MNAAIERGVSFLNSFSAVFAQRGGFVFVFFNLTKQLLAFVFCIFSFRPLKRRILGMAPSTVVHFTSQQSRDLLQLLGEVKSLWRNTNLNQENGESGMGNREKRGIEGLYLTFQMIFLEFLRRTKEILHFGSVFPRENLNSLRTPLKRISFLFF